MLQKLLISITFCTALFANNIDFISLYKKKGIDAVEKKLNTLLTDKKYWETYIQNKDTSNGYYESIQYVLRCNKNIKNIKVYKQKSGKEKLIFNTAVILGKIKGDKEVEGDLKTPLGTYNLTRKLTDVDEFYGPLALVTNYPNSLDVMLGKTGGGIWIHGVPLQSKREPNTRGCIALDNNHLINLDNKIDVRKSILIIDKKTNETKASKEEIALTLAELYRWKKSWQESDIKEYLSFYADEFTRRNEMNLTAFKRYKTRIFAKNEKKHIFFKDINIIPYPNTLGKVIYKIMYHQTYYTKNYRSKGKKTLYIELINNKMKILYET
jgi:murein L,D-transpeptidase YafK